VSFPWPRSLFACTALLIAGTLTFFSLMAWSAIVWTTIIPAAEATAHVLAQRTVQAAAAYKSGTQLPEGVEVSAASGLPQVHGRADSSQTLYLRHLRRELQTDLPGSRIVITRAIMPTEIWIRMPQVAERWFVLRWQIARSETPLAMAGVFLAGGLLSLVAASLFARRLTAPLAGLAEAARRVGDGEATSIDVSSGPSEVRGLAAAFQATSQRLAEADEQRELMLAGLSHDLRSPLARMRVAVDLLESANAGLHDEIIADIEEIDRIVGQLLHYVRAGYREAPTLASADDIIRDSLRPYMRSGDVQLELRAGERRLLPVESVRRVIANLVQNALEYGRAPITVRAMLRPGELLVSVADRGPGISAQEWNQALRPFYRLRAAPGLGHCGLGLATVERLACAAQGKLSSKQIEDGFIVEVTFAIATE
jgi:two-component system, OmpR family, osmolarity sensor histidine kinase EnvZ